MIDQVRMISKTVFQNDRVTVFREDKDGELVGERGRTVVVGDKFMTDVLHAKELERKGFAEAYDVSLDDVEEPALEPHHQVSGDALAADRKKRGSGKSKPTDTTRELSLTQGVQHQAPAGPIDTTDAAATQANRADGAAPNPTETAKPVGTAT